MRSKHRAGALQTSAPDDTYLDGKLGRHQVHQKLLYNLLRAHTRRGGEKQEAKAISYWKRLQGNALGPHTRHAHPQPHKWE